MPGVESSGLETARPNTNTGTGTGAGASSVAVAVAVASQNLEPSFDID